MKTVNFGVTYNEKAGRLELLIRFLWAIPAYVVMIVLGCVGMVCWMLQWLHILVLGKKHPALHNWIKKYIAYGYKFISYFMLLTEERNPLMPED